MELRTFEIFAYNRKAQGRQRFIYCNGHAKRKRCKQNEKELILYLSLFVLVMVAKRGEVHYRKRLSGLATEERLPFGV